MNVYKYQYKRLSACNSMEHSDMVFKSLESKPKTTKPKVEAIQDIILPGAMMEQGPQNVQS